MSFLEQDVLGFDVAMDHAVPVRRVEAIRDLARDAHRLVDGQLPVPLQPLAERLVRVVYAGVSRDEANAAFTLMCRLYELRNSILHAGLVHIEKDMLAQVAAWTQAVIAAFLAHRRYKNLESLLQMAYPERPPG